MADGSISNQGDLLVKMDDGTVINLADVLNALKAGLVDNPDDTLAQKVLQNNLNNLSVDSAGRLRIAAESVGGSVTVTSAATVGNTQLGPYLAAAYAQLTSMQAFDLGFTSRLVVS